MNLSSMISHVVKSTIRPLGFDVVRSKNSNLTFDAHLANVLLLHEIDCVIDVGANTGQYGRLLRSLGFRGSIVSLEPVSVSFEKLSQASARDDRWHVFRLALGAEDGQQVINTFSGSQFASFHETTDYARRTWGHLHGTARETVDVRRLDGFMEDIRRVTGGRRFFLKVDTQGHDRFVLEGAAETLATLSAVQCELSMIPVYQNTTRAAEMLILMEEIGFRASGLYPINRDQSSLAVIEFDAIFVRYAGATMDTITTT